MTHRTLIREVLLNGKTTNILIEGNRFADIDAPSNTKADKIIDGKGKAILPPFYNAHTHAAMSLLRGYADDMPLFTWLNEHIWPYEAKMTSEDIYNGSRLAILEMIKSGTVFFGDMYFEVEQTIRAAQEMGVRAAVGVTFMDRLGEDKLASEFRFIDEWKDSPDGRVTISVAPHAIYTVSSELLKRCAGAARRNGLTLQIHLSETMQEVEECRKAHGTTPVRYLDSLGVLGENVIAAHAIHLDDEEIEILQRRGVTLADNPCSNMKLSSGVFRFKEIIAAGCKVAIGTDGSSSNNNLDMREEMKFAALLAKCKYDPEVLPATMVFDWATRGGAEAFGIDAGVIENGKLADAILLNLDNERLTPCHNLISNWVYAADSRCVDTVICDGRVIMEGGVVPGEADILEKARQSSERK